MSIAQSLLPEFDQEMANTRKVLERVPTEEWNWKPHEKSGTLGWLAGHVGTIPGWCTMMLQTEKLDYAPVDGPQYEPPKIENTQQLLAAFDKESTEARAALSKASDADFNMNWTLLAAGKEIFTMPRLAAHSSPCISACSMFRFPACTAPRRTNRKQQPVASGKICISL
jgi:hypothetical protein